MGSEIDILLEANRQGCVIVNKHSTAGCRCGSSSATPRHQCDSAKPSILAPSPATQTTFGYPYLQLSQSRGRFFFTPQERGIPCPMTLNAYA